MRWAAGTSHRMAPLGGTRTQATLDACALETIRGADSALDSLTLNSAPLITSLSPGLAAKSSGPFSYARKNHCSSKK